MKRFFLFALLATMFTACATDETQDVAVELAPDTLTVSFEGDDSRIQLQNGKTVWTQGDLVSVFYRSNANQKWQYQGSTGERTGNLKRVNAGNATETTSKVVVVYPYNERYYINPETCDVEAFLPAQQTFLKDSYGLDGNIMISSGYYNQFSLKNVCGWLKVQLTGNGEKVKSIKLKGNNGEQVAGQIYINSATAEATLASEMGGADDTENGAGGNLVFDDTILTEVTLDCGEGVELGAEPTAFYIGLPPQTFSKGISLEITSTDGAKMTKITKNEIVISQNTIQPMATFQSSIVPLALRTIYYETITPNIKIIPYNTSAFDSTILSNTYGEDGMGKIVFKDTITIIGEKAFYYKPQVEGNTTSYDCALYKITLPECVTSIGKQAFYCQVNLREIIIPESVKIIEDEAFYDCWNLRLIIPASVSYVGNNVVNTEEIYFAGSIPPTLATNALADIGRYIFVPYKHIETYRSAWSKYADKILGYDFVNNLPAPANNQIYYKTSDKKTIEPYSNNLEYMISSNVYHHRYILDYDGGDIGIMTFKNDITELEEKAFYDCRTLTEIYIPESVKSIAGHYGELNSEAGTWGAFWCCDSLKMVAIYGSPQIIGNPFVSTPSLSKFVSSYASDDGRCLIIGSTLFSFAPAGLEEYTIPSGVTTISAYAFYGCEYLKLITIPSTVTKFGYDAFDDCYNLSVNITDLTSWCKIDINNKYANPIYTGGEPLYINGIQVSTLTIPSSITIINKYIFEGVNVSEIIIGDYVTTIEDYAFEWNNATKITIGKNVKTIGAYAFNDTDSYPGNADVYIKATTPPTARYNQYGYWNAFNCQNSDRKIYVPRNSVSAYKAAEGWRDYADDIVGYDF